jgi:hypothetical protein
MMILKKRNSSMPVAPVSARELEFVSAAGEFKGRFVPDRPRPRADLLARFLRIAEAADTSKAAIAFSKRWGRLELCEHGLPWKHCSNPADGVDSYMQFSRCLEALGRIGLELKAGRSGGDVDWEIVEQIFAAGDDYELLSKEERAAFRGKPREARANFVNLMDRLIFLSDLRPRLQWDKKTQTWAIDFDSFAPSNLTAILALQLMSQLGGAAMKRCASCPRWFTPQGRQVYCELCGIRAAWRAAARKRRAATKTDR